MGTTLVGGIPPARWLGLAFSVAVAVAVTLPLASADEFVVATHPVSFLLPPGDLVQDSPGVKPTGTAVACNRVQFHGVSRFWNLGKYAHALKLRAALIVPEDAGSRMPSFEVCFHRNASIGVGMCREGRWEKVTKGRWVRSRSPFDHGILDLRMAQGQSSRFKIEISTEEEMLLHRAFFLVTGMAMMASAHWLSESMAVYYGSGMSIGVILVVLIILFQTTKLFPFGRRSSLAMLMYSSVVGVAGFLLHHLSDLLRSFLIELGISEDMQNPLGMFLIICLVLAGAWLGFWSVRKLVLSEDGSTVDESIAWFVKWAIRIFSAGMVVQSSLDLHLAVEALTVSILLTAITVRGTINFLFLVRLCNWFRKFVQRSKGCRKFPPNLSHLENCKSPIQKGIIEEVKNPSNIIEETENPSNMIEEVKSPGNMIEELKSPSNMIEEMKSASNINEEAKSHSKTVIEEAKGSSKDIIEEAKSASNHKIEDAETTGDNEIEWAQPRNVLQEEPLSVAAHPSVEPPAMTPPSKSKSVEEEIFLSTFHNTPNRRKLSKKEWEAITAETTERAMKELCSSPNFSRWAIANADRIAVTPKH